MWIPTTVDDDVTSLFGIVASAIQPGPTLESQMDLEMSQTSASIAPSEGNFTMNSTSMLHAFDQVSSVSFARPSHSHSRPRFRFRAGPVSICDLVSDPRASSGLFNKRRNLHGTVVEYLRFRGLRFSEHRVGGTMVNRSRARKTIDKGLSCHWKSKGGNSSWTPSSWVTRRRGRRLVRSLVGGG